MKQKIRILIPVLAAAILAVSCQGEEGYTASYYFGSRANMAFSKVTSTLTPGLRELAEMLTQKRDEIQKDYQFEYQFLLQYCDRKLQLPYYNSDVTIYQINLKNDTHILVHFLIMNKKVRGPLLLSYFSHTHFLL